MLKISKPRVFISIGWLLFLGFLLVVEFAATSCETESTRFLIESKPFDSYEHLFTDGASANQGAACLYDVRVKWTVLALYVVAPLVVIWNFPVLWRAFGIGVRLFVANRERSARGAIILSIGLIVLNVLLPPRGNAVSLNGMSRFLDAGRFEFDRNVHVELLFVQNLSIFMVLLLLLILLNLNRLLGKS